MVIYFLEEFIFLIYDFYYLGLAIGLLLVSIFDFFFYFIIKVVPTTLLTALLFKGGFSLIILNFNYSFYSFLLILLSVFDDVEIGIYPTPTAAAVVESMNEYELLD